jgi:hypothetical protein
MGKSFIGDVYSKKLLKTNIELLEKFKKYVLFTIGQDLKSEIFVEKLVLQT